MWGMLRAAGSARTGHSDSLGAELHRRLNGFLHRAAKSNPALQLGGDVLGDQLRIGLCLAHFNADQKQLVLGEALHGLSDRLAPRSSFADLIPLVPAVYIFLQLALSLLSL